LPLRSSGDRFTNQLTHIYYLSGGKHHMRSITTNGCKIELTLTALTMLGLATSQPADAASLYSITDLGTLGGDVSSALGINNAGQVVGQSFTVIGGQPRAFLWSEGRGMQNLGTLGGDNSAAFDINNAAEVVGYSYTGSGMRAFVWSESTGMRELGTLSLSNQSFAFGINDAGQVVGGLFQLFSGSEDRAFLWSESTGVQNLGTLGGNIGSTAFDINNAGQVVGFANTVDEQTRAFLWTESTGIRNLGSLGGYSFARAINDVGQVAGSSDTSITHSAFLWSENTGMQNLGTLGDERNPSFAFDLNNAGQVVGYSVILPSGQYRPFLWENGVMSDLNNLIPPDSGFTLFDAQGINDAGQIVGAGSINGEVHAVLLSPIRQPASVPEPASALGLLAFGALGTGSMLKRKLQKAA
jgi:probable HAF family extracellular repeat protein